MYKNLSFVLILLFPLPILAEESISEGLFKYHLNFANDGSPESIYVIAGMYERGRGVKQDYSKALKWYKLAVTKGNSRANKNIDKVLNKIALLKNKEIKNKELKNKDQESEESNLVSTMLKNEKKSNNAQQINPQSTQPEETEIPPTTKLTLENNKQINEPLSDQNNNLIRQISIQQTAPEKTQPPAPKISAQIANQDVQQNITQQSRMQELNRLQIETEKAKRQSELIQARYERLQEERASLLLQMTLERDLANKQKIEILKIRRQMEIDE
ncbi:MAG: hypothetical protein ACC707_13840 [Thiohalomonadales bacterium]